MKFRFNLLLPIILLAFACQSNTEKKNIAKKSKKTVPEGVIFNKETLKRLGASGDNWCLTWAADGSQIVSMCDGNWLDQKNYASQIHNHLYRIKVQKTLKGKTFPITLNSVAKKEVGLAMGLFL